MTPILRRPRLRGTGEQRSRSTLPRSQANGPSDKAPFRSGNVEKYIDKIFDLSFDLGAA
jgi:hypothetical protein